MTTQREITQMPERRSPASKMRAIISWIIETDRRFRMTQEQIDRMTDRF